jgi:hypothetical protein
MIFCTQKNVTKKSTYTGDAQIAMGNDNITRPLHHPTLQSVDPL